MNIIKRRWAGFYDNLLFGSIEIAEVAAQTQMVTKPIYDPAEQITHTDNF